MRQAFLVMPVLLGLVDAVLVNGREPGPGLGIGLGAAAVLMARRRWPVVVFLATMPGLYCGYVWFAPLIALYTVAAGRRPGGLLAGACALFAVAQFVPYPVAALAEYSPREIGLAAVDSCSAVGVPVALGLLARTRRELIANLAVLHRSRASERRLLAEQVLAAERARLAREMHDVVAHQVGLINLQAGALQVATDTSQAQEGARTIRELAVRTLDELRQLVGVLRETGPRLADVARLVDESGLGVSYRNDIPEGVRFPAAVERAAYRTVQEALTNARRYAPGADIRVLLVLEPVTGADGGVLRAEVHNGPPGPVGAPQEERGGGHGLVGLRERAHSLGGTLEARPTSDGGFLVTALLPVG